MSRFLLGAAHAAPAALVLVPAALLLALVLALLVIGLAAGYLTSERMGRLLSLIDRRRRARAAAPPPPLPGGVR